MIEKLKGINKEREIKERESTSLEKLLEIGKKIVRKYAVKLPAHFQRFYDEFKLDKLDEPYEDIYQELKCRELKGIDFSKTDLQNLVLSFVNNNSDNYEAIILGLYTGNLLHMLTQRNKEQGKRTNIYINGYGNRFDYLFFYAKVGNNLIVENFKGNWICAFVGHREKRVNRVIGKDIIGSNSFHSSKIDHLVLINIDGFCTAECCSGNILYYYNCNYFNPTDLSYHWNKIQTKEALEEYQKISQKCYL